MRVARRLLLLAVFAVTALGLMASSASAVEVVDESLTHCPAVTETTTINGGCPMKVVSNDHAEFVNHTFGAVIRCDVSFEARVGESGNGWGYNVSLTNCGQEGGLSATACSGSGEMHWPFQVSGKANPWTVTGEFCFVTSFLGERHCLLTGTLNIISHDLAELNLSDGPPDHDHKSCTASDSEESRFSDEIQAHMLIQEDASHPGLEIFP